MKDTEKKVIEILVEKIKQLESDLSVAKWTNENLKDELKKEQRPSTVKAEETR